MAHHVVFGRLAVAVLLAVLGSVAMGLMPVRAEEPVAETPSFDAQAGQVVIALAEGRFAEVRAQFDPTMMETLSEPTLANTWRTYQELLGEYEHVGQPTSVVRGALTVEQVPVQLKNAPGEVRITFHPDGTIGGLFFLTAGIPVP
jgi:hypothetical protein